MIYCLTGITVFFIVFPFYSIHSRGLSLLLKNHEKQTEEIRARMAETMKNQSPWRPYKAPGFQPAADRPKIKRTLRQWLADNNDNIVEGIVELILEILSSY